MLKRESFITTGKKSYSRLSGGLCCCVIKNKVPVVCLAGCAVVSVFGSGDYDRKKKVTVVCLAGCAVVSVFGFGVKSAFFLLWQEGFITTGKKSSSRLSGGLCCCVSFWFWRLRPEKKVTVVCLVGCTVLSVFGSGDYDQKKKSYSRRSGGLCCCVSFWFWREIGSFFVVAGKFYYNRKKKVTVVCLAGCAVASLKKKKIPVVCLVGCAVVSVFGSGDYDRKKKSYSRLSGGSVFGSGGK